MNDINDNEELQRRFEEFKQHFNLGEFDKALEFLEEILKKLEAEADFRKAGRVDERGNISLSEGDESICISLNHIMEYYVYMHWFKPDKDVVSYDYPMGEYYRTYGDLCIKLGKYKTAIAAYKNAVCWNPVDLDAILGLAEAYKHLNMLERYLIVTKQAYRYCCTRATMARYYRNMGYYHIAKYNVEVAEACYMYSNIYYKTDNADNELKYLEQALNRPQSEPEIKAMQEMLRNYDIEPGPDSDTIGVIYRVGELMMEDNAYSLARDCFSIVYDITREPQLADLLDELDKALKV